MGLIVRPTKQFGANTYTADFALAPVNPTPPPSNLYVIQTSEVDADFDTIYTLVNGNLNDANIVVGANIAGSKLADHSVPIKKLISNRVSVGINPSLAIANVEMDVGVLPTLTTLGNAVRLEGGPLSIEVVQGHSGNVSLRWYEDGGIVVTVTIPVANLTLTATENMIYPLPVPTFIHEAATAAAHVYKLTAQTTDANIAVLTGASQTGNLYAQEIP